MKDDVKEEKSKQELAQLRSEIGLVDDQLLNLSLRRLQLAKSIGEQKLKSGLPIKDYRVEKEVIERSRRKAREIGLAEDYAEQMIQLCIRHSVQLQDEMKAARSVHRKSSVQRLRIVIVGGLGNMGLWLADFFQSFDHEITLHDSPNAVASSNEAVASAQNRGMMLTTDLSAAVGQADLIALATPISVTAEVLAELTKLAPKALVFDICSLKSHLLEPIERARKAGLRITSIHPMFGPGVRVLSGRNILICDCGHNEATAAAQELFAATTAQVLTIPLLRHDALMSQVLGLSHLVNLLFARVLRASGFSFTELMANSSTTFKAQAAVARPVAAENQDLYFEIQAQNNHSDLLLHSIRTELDLLTHAITDEDREEFKRLMAECEGFFSGCK